MCQLKFLRSFLLLVLAVIPFSGVLAQETVDAPPPMANKPVDFRTTALRQLGLSQEQFQKIRALNQERKPLMDAAQVRLRQANRALDEIIYADNAGDADIQARLKDFQTAQAEVAKVRFMNELAVRRILTAEQLTRFRQLRVRFEQTRPGNNRPVLENPVRQRENQRPIQKLLKPNIRNRPF